MRPIRITISIIIVLLPLCLLSIGSYRLVHGVFTFLNSSSVIAATVSAEATRLLHRNVHIREVKITGNLWGMKASNTVDLMGVSVSEKISTDRRPFAQADKVVLHYTLDQVLYGDSRTPYITNLQLVRPALTIERDERGTWNFADLTQAKAGGGRVLTDLVSVSGGYVLLHDARFPSSRTAAKKPLVASLSEIKGVAQVHPDKSVAFDFGGLPDQSIARNLHVAGMVNPGRTNAAVRLQTGGLNLPELFERFVPRDAAYLVTGTADLDLDAIYSPVRQEERPSKIREFDPNALSVSGSVKVTNVTGTTASLASPLKSLNGSIDITNTSCSADVTCQLDELPIHITAGALGLPDLPSVTQGLDSYRARLRAREPLINCEATVPNGDLARLYRTLKIETMLPPLPDVVTKSIRGAEARGSLTVQVSGLLNNPSGGAVGHLVSARYDKVSAKNIDVDATLSNRVIVAGVHGAYAGGDANIRARINLDPVGAFAVEARGKNIHLASIGFNLKQLLGGAGDVDLAINGRKHRTPNITAQVQVNGLKLNNQTFQSAYGDSKSVGRTLVIRTLRVDDLKGFALANGTVDLTTHALNMKVDADGLDIHSLVEAATHASPLAADPSIPSLSNLEGVAYLRNGAITGTFEHPELNGDLSAYAVSTGKYDVDKAEASFRLSESGIVVGRGTLVRYPSIISFSGSVVAMNEPRPSFDFNVQAADVDIANIANILGVDANKYAVAGTVSTDDPAGVRVYGVKGAIRAQGVNAAGDNKPFPFSLHRASINGLKLASASAQAYYDSNGVHIAGSNIGVAGGSIKGTGTISPDGNVTADIVGSSLSLAQLTPVLKNPPAPEVDGKLGISAHVSGPAHSLAAAIDSLSIDSLKYRDMVLGSLTAKADYADNTLTLRNLELADAKTHGPLIEAPELTYNRESGAIGSPVASSDGAVRLTEIPFGELDTLVHTINNKDDVRALPVTLADVHGGLSASLGISGTLDNPLVDVKLNSHNLEVKDYVITALTGRADVTKEGVTGQTALMTIRPKVLPVGAQPNPEKQDATVSIRDYRVLKGGELKADVDITNVNLAFVQSAVDPTAVNPITGIGDKIGILASGTLQSPQLELSLNLSNVTYMDRTFERVDVDHARVEEGQIVVDSLRFTKIESKGVSYQAAVGGSIKGFTWAAPFLPDSATMDISAQIPTSGTNPNRADLKLLTDLGINLFRDSAGTFGGNLHVSGPIHSPRIVSGSFGFTADRVKIPGIQTQISALDAAFKITNDVVTVDRFTAHTQGYDRKGTLLPHRTSDEIHLRGSIPVGYGDTTPAAVSDPLTLTADNLQFEESQIPGSKTGGLLGTAAVNLTMTRSILRPIIAGTVNVSNSTIALPNDFSPMGGSGTQPTFNPRFDVALNLQGNNNRLKNRNELDARVGGSITFRGDLGSPVIHGRIDLNKGYLRVPPRQFDIVPPGSIVLDYGNTAVADSGLSVRINLTARTKLTAVSLGGIRKLYTVTVNANGPLNEGAGDTAASRMHLDFTTQPNDLAINQQDLSERLVTAIFGVDTFNQVGQNPGATALTALSNLFTGYVLPGEFNRFVGSLGLDQLAIGYDPYLQPSLLLTRQVAGPLYVTYNQAFTAENRYYDIKFSFRFHDRYQLSYDFDEQRTQEFLLEGVWRY